MNNRSGSSRADGIRLTERIIPVPQSISPEAQATLAREKPPQEPYPALGDKAGWRAFINQTNQRWRSIMRDRAMPHGGFSGAPEDQDIKDEFVRFLGKHMG